MLNNCPVSKIPSVESIGDSYLVIWSKDLETVNAVNAAIDEINRTEEGDRHE
jgi:hypothetical protein